MNFIKLKLVLVSTPIGSLGSGKGGGVELTLISLIKGLIFCGHKITLIAPSGSKIPFKNDALEIIFVSGNDQPSWQHQPHNSPIVIPSNSLLTNMLGKAIKLAPDHDAILNFAYDWLPLWITSYLTCPIFHLISMAGESGAMKEIISQISKDQKNRLAFHTKRQASDYLLFEDPIIVGNGFDPENYNFRASGGGPLGWAGRIAPEKGLEDAVKAVSSLGDKLVVWGLKEDLDYANKIEASVPKGTIDWRGFLPTEEFQSQLGFCRAFINTPKWNEAYGNVVVEALGCGVPVIAYDRGGPGELIESARTGWLVPPDDISGLINAIKKIEVIDRLTCRNWFENVASHKVFAKRVERWIFTALKNQK